MSRIGRLNRRFEDPTRLLGRGRCSDDSAALSAVTAAVRFVRRAQETKS